MYNPTLQTSLIEPNKDTQKSLDFSNISFNAPVEVNFSELLKSTLLDNNKEYPKPPTVLGIKRNNAIIPVLSKGSISALIGKAKGGKTGLSILFVAALLNSLIGDANLALTSSETGIILWFDTEQGQYYGSLTLARIKALCNNTDRLKYYNFREFDPIMRMQLIKTAIEQESSISLIVIDGLKDVVFDINNPTEATEIVTELMALSTQYDCHIINILHQNKGDANARGHLGTELTNKSETVFSVNKSPNDPNISIISAEYTRGIGFDDFAISRDENGTPRLSDQVPTENTERRSKKPNDFDLELHKKIALNIFQIKGEFSYTELISQTKLAFNGIGESFGDNKIKDIITHWTNNGFITHNGLKTTKAKYLLSLV